MKALGVKNVFIGVENKTAVFNKFLKSINEIPENAVYMGDDIPDIKPMTQAGIAACPSDAASEIKQVSQYISPMKGGQGCVRDIIEQVMKVQGKWMKNDAFSW